MRDRGAIVRRLATLLRYTSQRRSYMPHLTCVARGLGVSTRTLRRDLEALEQAGWPVPKWRDEVE